MADCDLSVELDQPDQVFTQRDTISGTVHVHAGGDVRCKALTVGTVWRTHGRGNVASGTTDEVVVFAGEWSAGESAQYRFELPVNPWPPSYHGHLLNVDHYVEAKADVPWAFDPKGSTSFQVAPQQHDDEAKRLATKPRNVKQAGPVATVVIVMFLLVFGGIFLLVAPFLLLLMIPVGLVGGGVYLFKKVLPRWVLGHVDLQWQQETFCRGETVHGRLVIRPKKEIQIQEIAVELEGLERCVSGSGTNRTTHTHTIVTVPRTISPPARLRPHTDHFFDCSIQLPDDAPLSIDLKDNKVLWNRRVRVDLPRWPDWMEESELVVTPGDDSGLQTNQPGTHATSASTGNQSVGNHDQAPAQVGAAVDGISFEETVSMIADYQDRHDDLEQLIDAVRGTLLRATISLDRQLLYAGEEGNFLRRGETAWWAEANQTVPPLRLTVMADDETSKQWRGRSGEQVAGQLEVIGFDHTGDRLRTRWISSE